MKNRLLLFTIILTLTCTLFLSSCAKKEADDEAVSGAVEDSVDKDADAGEQKEDGDKAEDEPSKEEENEPSDKTPTKEPEKDEEAPKKEEAESKDDGECAHNFGEWETKKKATCASEGEAERTCNECGKTEKKTLAKSEHIEVVAPAEEATCAKDGKTEGKHCSYCYEVLAEQKVIPKKEHNFKDGYSCECGDFVESAKFVVLSQNVRYADDGENKNISDRAPRFKQLVEKYNVDLIGTQESTPTWNKFYKENLKDYGMVGCSREGENATKGEWGTILYRLDRFELVDSDNFWLSETPEKVSRVSGSKCNRICTWALLKDKKTGKTFIFANTHLDHGTDEVREQQMKILLDELSDLISKYPLIITGDFNAKPDSKPYAVADDMLCDARTDAIEDKSIVSYTFDSYGQGSGKIIDYCFYNEKASAAWYKVANDQFGGYVSDHYGVLAQFGIK